MTAEQVFLAALASTYPVDDPSPLGAGSPGPRPEAGSVVSASDFRAAFGRHPAGVALITADPGDGPVALTATSVVSVSASPPLLVFALSALSSSAPAVRRSETVVVHLLSATEIALAKLGATSGVDRFADTGQWDRLPTGEPVFPAARTWIRGRIINTFDLAGSTLAVVLCLEVRARDTGETSEPLLGLVYHDRNFHALGQNSRVE